MNIRRNPDGIENGISMVVVSKVERNPRVGVSLPDTFMQFELIAQILRNMR